jgi:hypothetical protein
VRTRARTNVFLSLRTRGAPRKRCIWTRGEMVRGGTFALPRVTVRRPGPGRCLQIANCVIGGDGCGAGSRAWPQPPRGRALSLGPLSVRYDMSGFPDTSLLLVVPHPIPPRPSHPPARSPGEIAAAFEPPLSPGTTRMRAWPAEGLTAIRRRSSTSRRRHLSAVVTHRCLACTEPPDDAVCTHSSDQPCSPGRCCPQGAPSG